MERTSDERHRTAHRMAEFGGAFCKALAACWFAADDSNRTRLAPVLDAVAHEHPQYLDSGILASLDDREPVATYHMCEENDLDRDA